MECIWSGIRDVNSHDSHRPSLARVDFELVRPREGSSPIVGVSQSDMIEGRFNIFAVHSYLANLVKRYDRGVLEEESDISLVETWREKDPGLVLDRFKYPREEANQIHENARRHFGNDCWGKVFGFLGEFGAVRHAREVNRARIKRGFLFEYAGKPLVLDLDQMA